MDHTTGFLTRLGGSTWLLLFYLHVTLFSLLPSFIWGSSSPSPFVRKPRKQRGGESAKMRCDKMQVCNETNRWRLMKKLLNKKREDIELGSWINRGEGKARYLKTGHNSVVFIDSLAVMCWGPLAVLSLLHPHQLARCHPLFGVVSFLWTAFWFVGVWSWMVNYWWSAAAGKKILFNGLQKFFNESARIWDNLWSEQPTNKIPKSKHLIYLSDGPNSFGAALPKHQPLVTVQILGGFDEAKMHGSFVPCP